MPPIERLAQKIVTKLALAPDKQEDIAAALAGLEIVVEISTGSRSLQQLRNGRLATYKPQLLPLLAQLSEARIVRRGFQLPCTECGLTTWHPLGTADELVECPGCGGRFPLPVEHPADSEVQFHYVLNSLVNQAWDQGAIPALLAMRHVAASHKKVYCRIAGLKLWRADKPVGDVDFLMFADGQLVAGEAKTGVNPRGEGLPRSQAGRGGRGNPATCSGPPPPSAVRHSWVLMSCERDSRREGRR